jgi:hypothetical protein
MKKQLKNKGTQLRMQAPGERFELPASSLTAKPLSTWVPWNEMYK